MNYPWSNYYKLDKTCISSYSSLTLKEIGIPYTSPEWMAFMEKLHEGCYFGRLRGIILRTSYDAARQTLPEELRARFDDVNQRHLEEAESVAWQCEEGK